MGYTHYWRTRVGTAPEKLAAAQYDMHLLISNAKTPLANGHGQAGTDPVQEEGYLAFNGVEDHAHETFCWPPNFTERFPNHGAGETWDTPNEQRTGQLVCMPSVDPDGVERGFEFCKTARKPYDAVVGACLIAAKKHLGDDIIVSSDGSADEFLHGAGNYYRESGVETAAELYERTFGTPAKCPFKDGE